MKSYLKYFLFLVLFALTSCESLVDDINENPNDFNLDEVDSELFLNGAMLANSVAQAGHLNRIAGMYSGQLVGLASLYSNIYGFDISTAESVSTWSRIYIGTIGNVRLIREKTPDDNLLVGISKVVEAHAIGTAASLFGDVPYTEINDLDNIPDPKFDSQVAVFNSLITLLDDAISDLQSAIGRDLSQDIYFEGDPDKWVAAANTLKARYYLQLKNYSAAYDAALNGIADHDGSVRYIPRGDPDITEGDKNLFWEILEGSRAGDIGTANSYLIQLLDSESDFDRNNAKTNEEARLAFYSIDEDGGTDNFGVIEQYEPHNLITFAENQLILAETGARTRSFETGLDHLNTLRAWLNTGAMVNSNFSQMTFVYEAYIADDFASGGIENADGIDATRALLREIIEERYVSGFGMFLPFNDSRRLRKSDSDIAVPFFLEDGPAPPFAERFPYSDDELNSNANAPAEDPGIFTVTEVNR